LLALIVSAGGLPAGLAAAALLRCGLVARWDQVDSHVEPVQARGVKVVAEQAEGGGRVGAPVASTSTWSPVAVTAATDEPASLAHSSATAWTWLSRTAVLSIRSELTHSGTITTSKRAAMRATAPP
jgi:hypothetical protein